MTTDIDPGWHEAPTSSRSSVVLAIGATVVIAVVGALAFVVLGGDDEGIDDEEVERALHTIEARLDDLRDPDDAEFFVDDVRCATDLAASAATELATTVGLALADLEQLATGFSFGRGEEGYYCAWSQSFDAQEPQIEVGMSFGRYQRRLRDYGPESWGLEDAADLRYTDDIDLGTIEGGEAIYTCFAADSVICEIDWRRDGLVVNLYAFGGPEALQVSPDAIERIFVDALPEIVEDLAGPASG